MARLAAIARFRDERLQEPLEQYLELFDAYRGDVEELLRATADLTTIDAPALDILTRPALLAALRYVAGPPISEDDLKTLAEASLAARRLQRDHSMAGRVIETILTGLDRRRFPWVAEGREPKGSERETAAVASAALMAAQRLSTSRRSEGKNRQEGAVEAALVGAGFDQVTPRAVNTLEDAPRHGQFCREAMFGTRKADFVIGLWDGRKMPLECKVSNSSTNSVKRLNNDAVVKAVAWRQEFGTAQTVPAAMLSGVFKTNNLVAAQQDGLALFWSYKLEEFLGWIEETRTTS